MRSNQNVHTVFVVALVFLGVQVCGATSHQLPETVRTVLEKHHLPTDSLSLYVKEIGTPRPLLTVNSDLPRNPASVIKLVTTLAALEILGPDYRWKTRFYLDGALTDGGVLKGNFVIQGDGDPFFTAETFWHALFTLQAKGVKHIRGDLLIDDSRFEEESGAPGDFDNRPYRAYNVLPDAVLMNFNTHRFHLAPKEGRVHIYADPPTATLEIDNNLRLSNGTCHNKNQRFNYHVTPHDLGTRVTFLGEYPKACGASQLLRSVMQNDHYMYGVFKSLWEMLGGTITGTVGKAVVRKGVPLHDVLSKPLSEIITYINKYSNNVMARQLLLTMGRRVNGSSGVHNQGNKALGRQAIRDWLDAIRLSDPVLFMDNGAGLSREVRLSTTTMGELLEYAYHRSPYQAEFFASLPLFGVDGTVKKRLSGIIPKGAIRIKTGLLRDVRAMAGYVRRADNTHYIVVTLQNYPGIQYGVGTEVQDEILKWLYFHGGSVR